MGFSRLLPDHVLRLIDGAERKDLGKAGQTIAEVADAAAFSLEKELHLAYASWLNRNGFNQRFIHADPRKRSTLWIGHPDFTVWRGERLFFIEFKVSPNKLSPEQLARFVELEREGSTVKVCYSYESARDETIQFFNL